MPKFKKIGETVQQFWYDLNQIPYDYTVKVTNKFMLFDLVERMLENLWTEIRMGRGEQNRTHPKKQKCKKPKLLSEEALHI